MGGMSLCGDVRLRVPQFLCSLGAGAVCLSCKLSCLCQVRLELIRDWHEAFNGFLHSVIGD
jgi:hypothetical protein